MDEMTECGNRLTAQGEVLSSFPGVCPEEIVGTIESSETLVASKVVDNLMSLTELNNITRIPSVDLQEILQQPIGIEDLLPDTVDKETQTSTIDEEALRILADMGIKVETLAVDMKVYGLVSEVRSFFYRRFRMERMREEDEEDEEEEEKGASSVNRARP